MLKLFADPTQVGLYGTKEELEDTEDFFPFVYIPINVPWIRVDQNIILSKIKNIFLCRDSKPSINNSILPAQSNQNQPMMLSFVEL